jgi:hypothetical protein
MDMTLSPIAKKAIALLALLGVLFLLGIRVGHPQSGLRSALGSSTSSIAIYRQTSEVKVGDKVLSKLDSADQSPTLAFVRNISASTVDLQSDIQMHRVDRTAIQGNLIAIVPFIGTLLGVIGL